MLAKKLAALHTLVAARAKLKKPKKSDVAALEACVGELPADLGAFFAVFNGQDGTEPVVPDFWAPTFVIDL